MAKPEPVTEHRTKRRHTAIVLVSVVDRRILPALRFVSRLPDTEVRALHVSVEAFETRRLAEDWMELRHPLLHRRSARHIALLLQPLPGVTTVIVPYVVSLPTRPRPTGSMPRSR